MTLSFRPCTIEDVPLIVASLREPDRRELEALGDVAAEVRSSVERSRWAFVCEAPEGFVAAFGVAQADMISGSGWPWCVTSDLVTRYPRRFVIASRAFATAMKSEFYALSGDCWAGHTASLRWLRMLGFRVEEARPMRGSWWCRYHWNRRMS